MNIKTQRLLNLLIGIFLIIFGLYFANEFAANIHGVGSDVINTETNIKTLRDSTGEDLNQVILSALCAFAGIACGASHLWFLVFNTD